MPEKFKIALIQSSCGGDVSENERRAEELVREAAGREAKIICLQELFSLQYFCREMDAENFRLALPLENDLVDRFKSLARELDVAIILPFFEKRGEGIYHNTAVVIDAGGENLGAYRKTHIPDDPCFHEKFYFAPGDLGVSSFMTKFGEIGVLICWDQWFPETARLSALAGSKIIFYPSAIGWLEDDPESDSKNLEAWETVMRGHAVANGVFVAAVNRVGQEGPIRFWGNSFVADPYGSVTAKASETEEELLIAEIDLEVIKKRREFWPFFRDRRVDLYDKITRLHLP